MQKICHGKWIRTGRNNFNSIFLVGWLGFVWLFCYLRLQIGQSSLDFVREETEVRKFNRCEEEQDVISFGMVIA